MAGGLKRVFSCVQCIQGDAMHGYYSLLESMHLIGGPSISSCGYAPPTSGADDHDTRARRRDARAARRTPRRRVRPRTPRSVAIDGRRIEPRVYSAYSTMSCMVITSFRKHPLY